MSHFGTIQNYDSDKGRGTIAPEKGGRLLEFVKADLQEQAAEPVKGQRFGYQTRQVGGGEPQATNLQLQQGESERDVKREQAESQQG